MKKVLQGIKERIQYKVADVGGVSFPKSGRTWTKSLLGNYFSLLYGGGLNYEFCPLIKKTPAPRILFTHGKHRGEAEGSVDGFINRFKDKKILLMVRDPKEVVFSYYFRLLKRINDPLIKEMEFAEFLRDKKYGLPQIVSFMNRWYEKQEAYSGFYVSKYEKLLKNPEEELVKLLDFLEVPVVDSYVNKACIRSVDTTRKIEQGGVFVDEMVLNDLKKSCSYYEANEGGNEVYRYEGNDVLFARLMTKENISYVGEEMQKLEASFGY